MKYSRVFALMLSIILFTVPAVAGAGQVYLAESGFGDFNFISAQAADPVFASPGIDTFVDLTFTPVAGWTGAFNSAYDTEASGTTRNTLAWLIYFSDSFETTAFSFEAYVYLNTTLIDWTTVYYNGGLNGPVDGSCLSNLDNFSFEVHNIHPTPEPASLLLLGLGVLGVIPLRKLAK